MCSAFFEPTSDTDRAPHKTAILCVDDSPNILLICRTILEASGFQVFTASNGKAGLEVLKQHAIDAAVIDNRMPGMTGTELAREIKGAHKNVPILMFSDSGARPTSLDSIDLFLDKKNGPSALRDAVRSLLKNYSTEA
jgi:DNA-binding response OmpR family regulator